MGFLRKAAVGVCATGVGSAAFVFQMRQSASPPVAVLSADAFNATQDQVLANKLLAQLAANSHRAVKTNTPVVQPRMTLFRLLGCPYCARVKAVLDYYHLKYEEVTIDPISGSGIRDTRYPFAPQIMIGLESSDGPLIVDSEQIMRALSVPLRFERDLKDEKVIATRLWLIDRYQKVTFAVLSGTWWSAFQLYPQVVPPWWNYFPARVIGATALFGLSRFKIQPKLTGAGSAAPSPGQWLLAETSLFFDRFPSTSFHGGKTPDLADIEMLGVLRSVLNHSETGPILRGHERLGKWLKMMEESSESQA